MHDNGHHETPIKSSIGMALVVHHNSAHYLFRLASAQEKRGDIASPLFSTTTPLPWLRHGRKLRPELRVDGHDHVVGERQVRSRGGGDAVQGQEGAEGRRGACQVRERGGVPPPPRWPPGGGGVVGAPTPAPP